MMWVLKKNRLDETVLLSTKTYATTDGKENINNFTLKNFAYLNLWLVIVSPMPIVIYDGGISWT